RADQDRRRRLGRRQRDLPPGGVHRRRLLLAALVSDVPAVDRRRPAPDLLPAARARDHAARSADLVVSRLGGRDRGLGPPRPVPRSAAVSVGAVRGLGSAWPWLYELQMGIETEPQLAFVVREIEPPGVEVRVNFGVFAGRAPTPAEIDELAKSLVPKVGEVSIVAEERHE